MTSSSKNYNYITVTLNKQQLSPQKPININPTHPTFINYSPQDQTLSIFTQAPPIKDSITYQNVKFIQSPVVYHFPQNFGRENKQKFALAAFVILTYTNNNKETKHFIVRRQHNLPILGGHLALPGGFVEKGETPFDAAKRKVFEEVGIVLPDAQCYSDTYLVESAPEKSQSVNLMLIYVIHVGSELQADLSSPTAQIQTHSVCWWNTKDLFSELCSPKDAKTFAPSMKLALSAHITLSTDNNVNKKAKTEPSIDQQKLDKLIRDHPNEQWRQIFMFDDYGHDSHFYLIPNSIWDDDTDDDLMNKLSSKEQFFPSDDGFDDLETRIQKGGKWESFGAFHPSDIRGQLPIKIICQYFGSWCG